MKKEYVDLVKAHNPCKECLKFFKSCKDIEEFFSLGEAYAKGYAAWLLVQLPQFADYCRWYKFDGSGWRYILTTHDIFAWRCTWGKLTGFDWSYLLSERPQFAGHCDWSKLTKDNWDCLLAYQPALAKYKPKED